MAANGPNGGCSSASSSEDEVQEAESEVVDEELATSEDVARAATSAAAAKQSVVKPPLQAAWPASAASEDGAAVTSGGSGGGGADSAAGSSEAAVGRGQMAIPQAALAVDQASVKRRLKVQDKRVENDLRDFIRAGDVLNYLGGNRWGHVVMALGNPKAYEVPVLYTAERLPDGAIPMDSYSVTVRRASAEEPWGFALAAEDDGKNSSASSGQDNSHLVVKSLREGGPLEAWNNTLPRNRIRYDDRVVEVNGIRGNAQAMLSAAELSNELELKLWRVADMSVLAYRVPVYAVEVLQSASNMREISESTVCLVVHPLRKVVCPVGPTKDGFRMSIGHNKAPVQVQVLMSPLSNSTIDFHLFRLAVQEVVCAPHDQKWSMRTAVRSYLRNAAIRPEKYQQAKDKMKLGSKLSERWAERPICSTVPARVWQKYYLKRAYKERDTRSSSPKQSVTSCSTLCLSSIPTAGNFSAEAAFADEVLRSMPVRDDRVLPEDLVTILLGTGKWEELDLDKGPPPGRVNDRPAQQREQAVSGTKSAAASCSAALGKAASGTLMPRAPLPAGACNRDGALVFLGIDQFTVYCGMQVSRPKQATARMFSVDGEPTRAAQKFAWDGRCGPVQGPQCSACRWFEDRLIA